LKQSHGISHGVKHMTCIRHVYDFNLKTVIPTSKELLISFVLKSKLIFSLH
jgi:hypothetical protein